MITRTPLTDSVDWLHDCIAGDGHHMHLSQYLVRGRDGNVLIDAGSNDAGETSAAIDDATGGAGVDALLFSHSILPHTQNYADIRREWGDIETVISASNKPELQGMEGAQSKVLNAVAEVCGQEFRFIDPILTDVVNSAWIFDVENGVLFTAEGVGHYHRDGECDWTTADFDGTFPLEYVNRFHRDKLPFLRFVDPEKLREAFDFILSEFDVEYLAPIHGNPVPGDRIDEYVEVVLRSVAEYAGE